MLTGITVFGIGVNGSLVILSKTTKKKKKFCFNDKIKKKKKKLILNSLIEKKIKKIINKSLKLKYLYQRIFKIKICKNN
jgi:hypothetical protein